MPSINCPKCNQELGSELNTCPNCGASLQIRPLARFALFYFVGIFAFILLYGLYAGADAAGVVAAIWAMVGAALILIIYGRPRKAKSSVAALLYLAGIAWLILLLAIGIFRIVY